MFIYFTSEPEVVLFRVVPSFNAFLFVIPNVQADRERGRAVSDWTTERQMPFLQPPSSPDDGVPDDFPDVDKRSCLLLGPTALVRTNRRSRPDAI